MAHFTNLSSSRRGRARITVFGVKKHFNYVTLQKNQLKLSTGQNDTFTLLQYLLKYLHSGLGQKNRGKILSICGTKISVFDVRNYFNYAKNQENHILFEYILIDFHLVPDKTDIARILAFLAFLVLWFRNRRNYVTHPLQLPVWKIFRGSWRKDQEVLRKVVFHDKNAFWLILRSESLEPGSC